MHATLIDWLFSWLIDYLLSWLIDYLLSWLIDYLLSWLIDYLLSWLIDYLLSWLIDWFIIKLNNWLIKLIKAWMRHLLFIYYSSDSWLINWLTDRLIRLDELVPPSWPVKVLQKIAKYVFETENKEHNDVINLESISKKIACARRIKQSTFGGLFR